MTMKCKQHDVEFDPLKGEGFPTCVAERRTAALATQVKDKLEQDLNLVKVQYFSTTTGEISPREYTYYSENRLEVGTIVEVPVKDHTIKAKVSAINVPVSEIEEFKDKVKSIPAGSKMAFQPEPVEVEESPKQDLPPGGLAEAARMAEAEVTVVNMVEQGVGEHLRITDSLLAESVGPVAEVVTGLVSLEVDSAVQVLVREAKRFLDYADGRVVNSPTSEKSASADLILIRNTKKQIEAKRKEYLDPVNAKAANIRDFFKTLMDPIEEADKLTGGMILSYGAEVTRQREEAERIEAAALQLAKDQEKLTGEHTVSLAEIPKPAEEKKRVRTDLGLTSKVDHWKWKVVDPDAIPREYLIPDEAMLNSIATTHHDRNPVDGILFYNEPYMATRGK